LIRSTTGFVSPIFAGWVASYHRRGCGTDARYDRVELQVEVRERVPIDFRHCLGHSAESFLEPLRCQRPVVELRKSPQAAPQTGRRPLFEQHRAIVAHDQHRERIALRSLLANPARRQDALQSLLLRYAVLRHRTSRAQRT
jgi:hypothetical protein